MKTRFVIPLLAAAALSACSPKFDWRDYRSSDAPYAVLFPGKPATFSRSVDLDGQQVNMTMSAADIDGTLFAVGSAEVADPAKAQLAVQAMKTAMLRNIGAAGGKESTKDGGFNIEARGQNRGVPMLMHGRFLARGKRVYQVVVLGPERDFRQENVDTFMSSFKLN
ncbi:hypothetical protein [Massilia endophytica]|uniref:hypothetical protein n=1 Tax=Massilia endophytica TaxID=2899220 RepID=UPI001E36E0BE|nr:hypothetical protein [Massilia endophytica]UGQ46979.1 hypothetical protein LSQ66_00445 [Massilia endophytica]